MSDEDISLDEKRVFEDRRGTAHVFVASDLGLARVEVSDDQIGRFGLEHRGETRDVAVSERDETIAIATDEDVLIDDGQGFERTEFGPAVAVAFDDAPLAADADGHLARYADGTWTVVARTGASVRAMDGNLLATAVGVYRLDRDEDDPGVGLADVRDVASTGPYAATGAGLYHLEGGVWRAERRGDGTVVAAGAGGAAAVLDGAVLEREIDGWAAANCPASDVADLAVGQATYAVTSEGQLFVDAPTAKDGAEGWATRSLGLAGVRHITVLEPTA